MTHLDLEHVLFLEKNKLLIASLTFVVSCAFNMSSTMSDRAICNSFKKEIQKNSEYNFLVSPYITNNNFFFCFFSNTHSIFLVNNYNLTGQGILVLQACLSNIKTLCQKSTNPQNNRNLQEYHQCGYLSRPPKVQPPCLSVQPWRELHHGQHQTPWSKLMTRNSNEQKSLLDSETPYFIRSYPV